MANIHLLEDEEVLGSLYKKYLEKDGHKVIWSKTVEDAKEELKKFTPDLVLIDHAINGQETTGLDFLYYVKKTIPKAKMIMLSNYGHLDLQKEVIRAGAIDFLIKLNNPPKVLVEKIKTILK